MIKNVVICFCFSLCSVFVMANKNTNTLFCNYDKACLQGKLDSLLINKDKNFDVVDQMIEEFNHLSEDKSGWKENSLGLLYMMKENKENIHIAEQLFLNSFSKGNMIAAQNAAELYFYQDNFNSSIDFLKKIEKSKPIFKSEAYINWARLYAQILYLDKGEFRNVNHSLELILDIIDDDKSGVSHYLLGHYFFTQNDAENAIKYLKVSVELQTTDAALLLGDIYHVGLLGVGVDLDLAIAFYNIGADNDISRAHYNLAIIYHAKKDIKKMKYHLNQASELGHTKAIALLQKLE